MLSARNALVSGPPAGFFAGKRIAKVRLGKGRFSLAGNTKIMVKKDFVPKVRDE
jgi:hypothetical protein